MNQAIETNGAANDVRKARPPRDTTHNDIRQMVRQILVRSGLTVEKTFTGKGGDFPVATFQVTGDIVEKTYGRYYLGKKLDKRLEGTGYHADLQRKERKVESILIDIRQGEREQDAA